MKKSLINFIGLLSLVPTTSLASDNIDFDQFLTTEIQKKTIEKSVFVTEINKADIKRIAAQNIPDILELIPGIISSSPFGSYSIASYRGSDEYPRRVALYINGVPTNIASTGSFPWETVPINIEEINRVTFTPSPGLEFNSASGVLNIETVEPEVLNGKIKAGLGSNSEKTIYLRTSSSLSDTVSAQLSIKKYQSDNGVHVTNSDSDINKMTSSITYSPDSKNKIIFNAGLGSSRADFNVDERQKQSLTYKGRETSNFQGNITWKNFSAGETIFILGRNDYYFNVKNDLRQIPNPLLKNSFLTPVFDTSYNSSRSFVSLGNFQQIGNFSVNFKLEHYIDLETPKYFSKTEKKWTNKTSNLELSSDYHAKSGMLYGAGISVSDASSAQYYLNNFFLKTGFQPDSSTYTGILLSNANRYPVNWESLSEHYVYFKETDLLTLDRDHGNKDLRPEENTSFSLIFNKSKSNYSIGSRIFYDQYKDMITYQWKQVPTGTGLMTFEGLPLSAVNSSLNNDKMTIIGFELNSKLNLTKNTYLFSSFSLNEVEGHSKNIMDRKNSVPKYIYNVSVDHDFKNQLSAGIKFYGFSKLKYESTSSNDDVKNNPGYNSLSIFVDKCFVAGALEDFCVRAEGDNLISAQRSFYDRKENQDSFIFRLSATYNF